MLVILSPHSVALRWVQRELAFADAKGKRVLPLLYKPCGLPAWFELRFGNLQRTDFSRGSYETNLTELLVSIKQVLRLTVAPPAPAPRPKPPARPTPPDVLTITSPIHLELVRVPAGEFLMGSDPAKDKDSYDFEQPQHRVYVSEFYIGKHPVTNEQYAAFVKATQHEAPEHWERGEVPSGKENHPVVYVSWHDAVVFCQWLSQETGKTFRLPTEAEWEKAARGPDGRICPWGNEWDETKLNSEEAGPGDTTPVGQYSPGGDSPYGAADMSGNVWEWCADWYNEEEYQRRVKSTVKDPRGPKKGKSRVLRGGAFPIDHGGVRCAYRFGDAPNNRDGDGGFRVVVSPVPSAL
jgi:formylglycine-generating enzyme required for sulfatase activity